MKEANGRIFYLPCLMISEIENLFLIWDIYMLVCVLGSFLDLGDCVISLLIKGTVHCHLC